MIDIEDVTRAFWKLLQRGQEVPDLAEVAHRPDWHARAACRDHGPDLFFAGDDASNRQAKEICAGCPVRRQCEAAVPRTGSPGIWGGLTPDDRRVIWETNA